MSLITKEVNNSEAPKSIWSREQENLLAKWADKALCYRWLHDLSEKKFTRLNNFIQIPVIILSTATGAVNVGIDSIFPLSMKQYANISLGGISILTGIISTVGNFLRYAQNMEGHRVSSIQWSKFHRNIVAEINIHPDQRQDAVEFFTVCRAELDRLIEQSPSIPNDIIEAFEKRFNEVNISKPEVCNILEPTTIFKPHNGEDWTKSSSPHDGKTKFNLFGKNKKDKLDKSDKPDLIINNNTDSDKDDVITFDNNTPKPKVKINIVGDKEEKEILANHRAILDVLNK